jgi:5-methylthioribose kinase
LSAELLDVESVVPYLRSRGLLHGSATARTLAGGVSNVVLAVSDDSRSLVLKQSLEKLRVADDWIAPRRRILSEAAALGVVAGLTPNVTPEVVDVDGDRMTLTMLRAPEEWRDWKTDLMQGRIDPVVARRLGELLGVWHSSTGDASALPAVLREDAEAFEQLRLDPYFEAVALRAPEVAVRVRGVAERLRQTRRCLVHGDFSPKNILSGEDGRCWVIDFEVAHFGDPAFDVAFLLSHLLLKSLHRPELADEYGSAGAVFLAAYELTGPVIPFERVSDQLACLLLARVRGKSPVEYLDDNGRNEAWRLGTGLLDSPAATLAEVHARRKDLTR